MKSADNTCAIACSINLTLHGDGYIDGLQGAPALAAYIRHKNAYKMFKHRGAFPDPALIDLTCVRLISTAR